MKKFFLVIAAFFRFLWKFLTTGAAVASTLILITSLVLLAAIFLRRPVTTELPNNAALMLAPRGSIVEKKSPFDPFSKVLSNLAGEPVHEELLIQDVIEGIRAAGADNRIKLLVVAPDRLQQISLDQIRDIGQAIQDFKQHGKVVIAVGDNFDQGKYYLASWADEIYLNPMGSVNIPGFGVFRLYIADLLDKLSVNFHIFKVGTFKSALEPFIRNDMSPEAKEANRQWLNKIWDTYTDDIAKNRGLPKRAITNAANKLADNMLAARGDSAQMAMNNGFIDGLKTKQQLLNYLTTIVGASTDNTSFKQIKFSTYLRAISKTSDHKTDGTDRVGIITAQGNIIYGQGQVGQIGSDQLCRQIRRARQNDSIKALVLRVDSGGGSAFASELIRQELLLTKQAGKPVVVSMGSMAASGAYWISADANTIFASPTTLTGSIGIFGAMPTFEKSLAKIGVVSDGIGTTDLAGAGSPTREFPASLSKAIQAGVEHGYRKFLQIVATGRKLDIKKVKDIAEGRVWDGATAQKLGLVDKLGSLDDAVDEAARLANLAEANAVFLQDTESPAEQLLKNLGLAEHALAVKESALLPVAGMLLDDLQHKYDFLFTKDPRNLYSHCLLPGTINEL